MNFEHCQGGEKVVNFIEWLESSLFKTGSGSRHERVIRWYDYDMINLTAEADSNKYPIKFMGLTEGKSH